MWYYLDDFMLLENNITLYPSQEATCVKRATINTNTQGFDDKMKYFKDIIDQSVQCYGLYYVIT